MQIAIDPTREQRLELILQQIDALPTLSPVAVRVLKVTGERDTDVQEIIRLIESDPALTARVLSMMRRADRITRTEITSVSRAVMLIGLDALRAAMLSTEVFGLLVQSDETDGSDGLIEPGGAAPFAHAELWRHCIAVACAAELIAEQRQTERLRSIEPSHAFLAGLLHDLGKLALDRVLPKTYATVARASEQRGSNIADIERRVIGIDHHVAGKRLAEHWGLPHALQDVMWLHGQPRSSLPDLAHRDLIGVVTVADAVARGLHLGWSGNFRQAPSAHELAREWGFEPSIVGAISEELHRRVGERAETLGLGETTSEELLHQSIANANRQLGRLAASFEERSRSAAQFTAGVDSLTAFLRNTDHHRGLADAFIGVMESARTVFGSGYYAFLWRPRTDAEWLFHRFSCDGRLTADLRLGRAPEGLDALPSGACQESSFSHAGFLEWVRVGVGRELESVADLRTLQLNEPTGQATLLLHDRGPLDALVQPRVLRALAATWSTVIASAARHAGAKHLGERLAEANRKLNEMQSTLVEEQSMARLGRLTAGAAHEMNNPLTVISGKSQLLASRSSDPEIVGAAEAITRASEKLSELIESLYLLAEPPAPVRKRCDVLDLIHGAAKEAREHAGSDNHPVQVVYERPLPPAWVDREQIASALTEVILNAIQSSPRSFIEVRPHIDEADDRLMITVKDDGAGMSPETIRHACDPFFSSLPAGRRTGLGLARARRLIELHGGELALSSALGEGTTARIALEHWRSPAAEAGQRAA